MSEHKEKNDESRRLLIKELAKKLFSTGAGAVQITEESIRAIISEINPREVVSAVIESLSKSTDQIQTVFIRELRRYIDTINFRDELGQLLSNYTLEIDAKIHFTPKDKSLIKKKKATKEDSDNTTVNINFIPKDEASE